MTDTYDLWPSGTTAYGSTVHLPLSSTCDASCTFDAKNAIDNNLTTKWNDDTPDQWPDILTITSGQPVSLTGVYVISEQGGFITQFSVGISPNLSIESITTVAQLSNINDIITNVSFPQIASVVQLQITVDAAQSSVAGNYTRIDEVYPIYAVNASSSSTTTTASPTSSSSPTTSTTTTPASSSSSSSSGSGGGASHTGAIVGGVVGGVLGVALLVGIISWTVLRNRRNRNANSKANNNKNRFAGAADNAAELPDKSFSDRTELELNKPIQEMH